MVVDFWTYTCINWLRTLPYLRAWSQKYQIDGQRPGAAHGLDVDDSGSGTASEHRLYHLIRQPNAIVDRTFAIEFLDAGIEAFSFTFG